jgi:cysteine desulfurase
MHNYSMSYEMVIQTRFACAVIICMWRVRAQTYWGCINLSFAYVEGESLLMALKHVALSSGSACTSASLEPSYVLRAIGTDEDLAHSSIRFGIGRFTTEQEVRPTLSSFVKLVGM